MKKLLLLSMFFLLVFAFKSKATEIASYPYSSIPGGASGGGLTIDSCGNMETDEIYYESIPGLTLIGTELEIVAHGNVSGDIYIVVQGFTNGNTFFTWDKAAFQAMYPNDTFIIQYNWECDYTDGVNPDVYLFGSGDFYDTL